MALEDVLRDEADGAQRALAALRVAAARSRARCASRSTGSDVRRADDRVALRARVLRACWRASGSSPRRSRRPAAPRRGCACSRLAVRRRTRGVGATNGRTDHRRPACGALAAVHPEQGRVLSVFLNLDPTEFATPPRAIVGDHVGDDRGGAQGRGEPTGSRTTSGWRCATTSSASARCSRGRRRRQRHPRASPSTPAGPRTCSRSSALRRPVESRVVLDRTPFVEPLVAARHRRALVRAARQPPRRAPVRRRRRRARGDRPDRGRRALPARPGRLVAGQLPALGREGGRRPPRQRRRRRVRRSTSSAGSTACWSARPTSCVGEFEAQAAPVPARADRRARSRVDVENAVARRRARGRAAEAIEEHVAHARARGARPARAGRRHAAAAAPAGIADGARRAQPGARRDAADRARASRRPGGVRLRGRAALRRRGRADDRASRSRTSSSRRSRRRSSSRADVIGRAPPRRPRPARRHRRRAALLMRVAVLGTGIMGAPMARNLAARRPRGPRLEPHAASRRRRSARRVAGVARRGGRRAPRSS